MGALLDRLDRPGRAVGIDLARTIALVGMIATHVIVATGDDGGLTFAHQVASGRASALFAVLAGVSMALVTGGATPRTGEAMRRARLGLAARAVLIGLIGLALGALDSGLAVILPSYALLFLLAVPFVGLRVRTLVVLAVVWGMLAPVVSQLVRPELPERLYVSPEFSSLADPGALLSDLVFTGYYPVLVWLTYLLIGLALGRCDLRGGALPRRLLYGGTMLALIATTVARTLVTSAEVRQALFPFAGTISDQEAWSMLVQNQFGNSPTGGSWWWLLMVSPHSSTPLDLAQTIGSSLAVIGACLLVAHLLPRALRPVLVLLAGAGTAPLTCYVVHVAMRTPQVPPAEEPGVYVIHLGVVLGLGAVLVLLGRRGPLEALVGLPGRLLARPAIERAR